MHGKDEALRFIKEFVQDLPIPRPSDLQRDAAEAAILRLIEIISSQVATRRGLADWLRVEFAIEKPNQKLADPLILDADSFVAEVRKVRGKNKPLSVTGLRNLREEHARTIEPLHPLGAEGMALERQIGDLV